MTAATTQSHRPGRRSRILLLTVGGLLVGCAPKSAVRAPVPVRGDPVRVTTGDYRQVYEFKELRGDVLVLHSETSDDPLSIPLASVDELEAVVGHRSRGNALRGAGWGLAVGAAVGAFLGSAMTQSSCDFLEFFCSTAPAEENAAVGAIALGVLGAPIGLIIGAANRPAVWAPVDSTALQIQAHASPGGFGLQLSWQPWRLE
jgi:hypothetical protein